MDFFFSSGRNPQPRLLTKPKAQKKSYEFSLCFSSLLQWKQVHRLFQLALPTIVVQLSFVIPPFLAASYVGRTYGDVALDGYTLAWGAGNLSTLSLLQGIFNACDTLGPRAHGADQFRQVGLVALRGFMASLLVIVPVNTVLLFSLNNILMSLDQDPEAVASACHFYPYYATSFPFYALYEILWKFLSAQNVLAPMVLSTLVCTSIVLPLGLHFFISFFGFAGAAMAITFFYIVECSFVILWLYVYQPHNPDTWPGLKSIPEALEWKPFLKFLFLGTGGMLAYLEWVYWEVLTVMIGTFGVLPLSAHTVPRQFTDIGYVIPLGMAIALAIRLGSTLSQADAPSAQALAKGMYSLSVVVFGLASISMYLFQDHIVHMFTTDPTVVTMCEEIWFHSCLYFFFFCLFGISSGIAIGLGMQFTFGIVSTVSMWFIGMPSTYYFAIVRKGGLVALWSCTWPPYLLTNLTMLLTFTFQDWGKIARAIQQQNKAEGINKKFHDVESLLSEAVPNRTN